MHPALDRRFRTHLYQTLMTCAVVFAGRAQAQACLTGTYTLNQTQGALTQTFQADTLTTDGAFASYHSRNWGDSSIVSVANGGSATLRPTATFMLLGPTAGRAIDQEVTLFIVGTSTQNSTTFCTSNAGEGALLLGSSTVARASTLGHTNGGVDGLPLVCVVPSVNTTLKPLLRVAAATPFTLTHGVFARSSPSDAVQFRMGSHFTRIAPGSVIVRCDAFPSVLGVGGAATSGLRIDSVWPNPSRGVFHANVFVPVGAPAFLRVFDVAGRVVLSRAVDPSAGARDIAFDARMAPGSYFIHLQQGMQTAVRQVVIAE